MISKNFRSEIEAAGFRIKIFKVEHLREISSDFKMLAEKGLLDEDFYKSNLADFNYDYTTDLVGARSVVMIGALSVKVLLNSAIKAVFTQQSFPLPICTHLSTDRLQA